MALKFNDGESFDTSGELRIIMRRDGFYVIGRGLLVPVDDRADGEAFIAAERKRDSDRRNWDFNPKGVTP